MSTREEEKKLVEVLSRDMLAKLKSNSHKYHWSTAKLQTLFRHLTDEVDELKDALEECKLREAQLECADIANFVAMIHDILQDRIEAIKKLKEAQNG